MIPSTTKVFSKNPALMMIIILSGYLLTSCGSDTQQASGPEPIEVEMSTVETKPYTARYTFPAEIESDDKADISTTLMGTITEVLVDVGDKVAQGDRLAEIKDDQIQSQRRQVEASLMQARASLVNAERNYERISNLYENGSATEQKFDEITAGRDMARANVEALEARIQQIDDQLEYAVLRAPFDGVISRKNMSAGDMASPGRPVLSIANPDAIKVTSQVSEMLIRRIKQDMTGEIRVRSAGLSGEQVRIYSVSQAANPRSRQYTIEGSLVDEDLVERLRTGMYAELSLELDGKPTVMIPKTALVERGQLTGIYTISENEQALLRWVRTGRENGTHVEVVSGLQPGERFVTETTETLRQGQPLQAK